MNAKVFSNNFYVLTEFYSLWFFYMKLDIRY
nr:MAG TPA: hypothetical protein [Caudoviricetes sp.]